MAFTISGAKLTLQDLETISRDKPILEFSPEILNKLKDSKVSADEETTTLAHQYLEVQTVGFGPELSEEKVRLALIISLQVLATADTANIPADLLNRLLAFYNREVSPVVLTQGTPTGQTAQLLLTLLGTGKVKYLGYDLNAADIMDIFSWQPLSLTPAAVAEVINSNIFSRSALAYNLIKTKPIINWFNYLASSFVSISSDDLLLLKSQLVQFTAAFDLAQNIFEDNLTKNLSQEQIKEINNASINLIYSLNSTAISIATCTAETFENLISTSEPPVTSAFSQGLLLTKNIQNQISISVPAFPDDISTEIKNQLLHHNLENMLHYSEQLVALAFWSISQVGKVFNMASENLALAAYYHSDLFVPKEPVTNQLDNILRFIRTHSAPALT